MSVSAGIERLHGFFERAALRWPDAVAIDVPPGRHRPGRQLITYAELARQAQAIARVLAPLVTSDAIVAILASRDSPAVYAGQLGVLMAGAAYTCLDPAFPDQQLRDTLSDAGAVALLADAPGGARLRGLRFTHPPVIDLDSTIREASIDPGQRPAPVWLTPRSLAYVIYTSGTTGRPKGVMIEHAGIANLVSANLEAFPLGPGDRVGQSSSLAYDSSIEETWLALASGATLVVVDDDTVRLGPDLVAWLRHEHIHVLCPPPTLLRTTGCHDPAAALPELRLLYVGGEALPEDVAHRWGRGRQLVNGYGPTEATVTAIRERVLDAGAVAIGTPVARVRAWVLNETGDEAVGSERGELCLGGVGLARGYRHLPDLTEKKFPVHPRLGRIYRTGDLAHQASDGRFFYHGRLDSLVKMRGYRIELEAVEARLAECEGVRAAACCLQGDGARQTLIAFVIPDDPRSVPSADRLRASLALVLPSYMVPSQVHVLSALPTTISGKLDRASLPIVELTGDGATHGPVTPPETALEAAIAAAFQHTLHLREPVSVHHDFFRDLGGDSLGAAMLVSLLREHPQTANIATRDVYDAPTVALLAKRASVLGRAEAPPAQAQESPPSVSAAGVAAATVVQGLWLLLELMVGAPLAYLLAFRALPWFAEGAGIVSTIVLAPLIWVTARTALVPVAVVLTLTTKRLLIGRYRPRRDRAWSSFYVRNWVVHRMARLIPWDMLAGTEYLNTVLRLLGAQIGQRVHIHRGVDVSRGGWDLLSVGDDVTIARDGAIRLVDIDRGHIEAGAITLGDRATLDVRAGMGPNSSLSRDASLAAWSSLGSGGHVPEGERWDGIPARASGRSPSVPAIERHASALTPRTYAAALVLSRALLWWLVVLPLDLIAIAIVIGLRVDTDTAMHLLHGGAWSVSGVLLVISTAAIGVPMTLAAEAFAVRALGATRPGVISRWSWEYLRVWLTCGVLESAGTWLSGTIFWPLWLRRAGMAIGPRGEISTIIDTVPRLVELGPECFLADGIYLGGPRVDRGSVTLGRVQLGARTFVGNHAVIAGGVVVPDDVLLGVCTVANPRDMRPGSSWFGLPPIELPTREIAVADRRLTHAPGRMRYANRVFWEVLRCLLPAGPILAGLAWVIGIGAAEQTQTRLVVMLLVVPLWTFAAAATLCGVVLALKWGLLGRVRPGTHPLWSCWCSRWDFLYVAWQMYGRGLLSSLEGTLWLSWYLRAMGMTIGRRVLLGYGFAQVVDPDMLVLEDETTVSAMFQAHTFEDRVLKIDRIYVRRGASVADGTVPLYGADIGPGAHVAAHSVVMKRERLMPATWYEGAPTRRVERPPP